MPDTTQASGIFSAESGRVVDTTREGLPQGKVTLSGRT